MKQRKGRLVTSQSTDEIFTSQGANAYWNSVDKTPDRIDAKNKIDEHVLANPDSLEDSDENKLWGRGSSPELAGRIVEEFADEHGNFPVLSKQENMVLRLFITTGDFKEVQRLSKLSKSSINTYMARIRSKMLRLLKSRDF